MQDTENWLTGFGWDEFSVLAAMLAFFLEQPKGRTIHSPYSFWRTNITEKWKSHFDSLITLKKNNWSKLDAGISQINVIWNGRDDKP